MIRFCVPLIALMLAFSGVANAKLVGRWDPAAYAQGKFKVQKTAVIRKAPAPKKIHAQKKRVVVKVDYTGKLLHKEVELAEH